MRPSSPGMPAWLLAMHIAMAVFCVMASFTTWLFGGPMVVVWIAFGLVFAALSVWDFIRS